MRGSPSPFLRALLVLLLGAGLLVLYAQEFLGLSLPVLGKILFANYSYASHLEVRSKIVSFQLLQARRERTILVLGDSIVEGALWPNLCGATVINGGIGGGSMLTVLDVMPGWLDRKFDAIVIAAGVNDAARIRPTPPAQFRERLEGVVRRAQANAKAVLVATVLPVETSGTLGESTYDPKLIAAYTAEIRGAAKRSGVLLIDFNRAFGVGEDGPLKAGTTLDGVHLTPESYAIWLGEVSRAVTAAGECGPAG